MKGGDISDRPYPYVLFQFHEVANIAEPKFEFMGKWMPSRYWSKNKTGRTLMNRYFDEYTVCVVVYEPIQEAVEKWLTEHLYVFNKVLFVADRQALDEYLTSPDVLGILSSSGADGFGRCCAKMIRWSEL